MKKILAIIMVCVCSANVSIAQNKYPHMRKIPRFERLDSATRSNLMKERESWAKQVKNNEKKWKKHMAWGGFSHRWDGKRPQFKFDFVPQEQLPEFIGGEEALMNWISDNITYPLSADVNSIEGKVVVTFDVNADGSIGNVKVKESSHPMLDSEVVSKVESMPSWIPAKQNGRKVKVKYTLPIVFKEQA